MAGARVGIVGGGISGLAAAWHLVEADPALQVVLLDGSDRPGGKLRGGLVAGVPTDLGAESMLARRPEALELARAVGLGELVVHPAAGTASIWSRGALHPMPAGTLMGVPGTPAAALGVLDAEEIARAERERDRQHQPLEADVSVGEFVEQRMGTAVVDRLVEPLLGGVYAGHARRLSLQAAVPALWSAARSGESITAVAERAASAVPATRGPVFAGLDGGVFQLARTLASALTARGVRILSDTTVRAVERTARGWRLVSGPVPAPMETLVDAVILAVPAAPAARLLGDESAEAARLLAEIPYASMAIVTLALPRPALPPLPGSGFLVPPVDGRTIKAATFSANKWSWVQAHAPDLFLLRTSVGRQGEEAQLQRSDGELVAVALADLSEALGARLPSPVDSSVQRWGGALPQYTVGHVDRVARIREHVTGVPGLEVAGAAYDGVGVPACIGSGRAAAEATLTHLRSAAAAGGQ
jgi:protoporphyrinogen/coproporphyrinogen III oxidase